MKKSEAMEIQKRYGMEILRDPVTSEAWAVYLESPVCIQELDDLDMDQISAAYHLGKQLADNH